MQKKNTFFMYVDKKKSRIRETTNLSTDADSSTNVIVSAGVKKRADSIFRKSFAIFGNFQDHWQSLVIFGVLWRSLPIFDNLWQSFAIFGDLQRSSVIFGNLRQSTVIPGKLQQYLVIF